MESEGSQLSTVAVARGGEMKKAKTGRKTVKAVKMDFSADRSFAQWMEEQEAASKGTSTPEPMAHKEGTEKSGASASAAKCEAD